MSFLKNYLIGLIASALVFTLAEELAPKRLRAALSLCLGIYLLGAVIAPLPQLLGGDILGTDIFPDSSLGDSAGGEYFDTVMDATAEGVSRAIAERFGVDVEDVEVTLIGFDAYTISAESVHILLRGAAAYIDFHAVERYASEIFGGSDGTTKCTVEIALG